VGGEGEMAATIRRASPEDVESILDLLAFYEQPRSYFEPFYLSDPSYRSEHSWVVEEDRHLIAHLRVFDRSIRVGGVRLHIAGVGSVITVPDHRGHGYAGRLLRAMLDAIPDEGFSYSLLRAYQPILYERHGWAPLDQELIRAEIPPVSAGSATITPFTDDDLPEVMRLYEETNAERTGPTIRSPEYWRAQLQWLQEDRDGFLVARTDDGVLAGYVRSRSGPDATEVLELGVRAGDLEVGRTLLSATAARSAGRIKGHLPPSLRTVFQLDEREVVDEFGLMGRVIDLGALVATLEPVWLRRVQSSGSGGGSFQLSTDAGRAEVRVSASGIEVDTQTDIDVAPLLDERAFVHLLFRGFDGSAGDSIGAQPNSSLLQVLFPEQDFVIWRADAF
jgi:GNAT superfamily N-acetyltransferase